MSDTELPDPKLLRLFDLLYDLRNVTRVAEQLGQSQPTVSIGLGRLRRILADPLFVKTAEGMVPTPQADALIEPCREVLESLRRLTDREPTWNPRTARRTFRICMSDASHVTLLPRLLAAIRTEAPGVHLAVTGIDGNTEHALESGEADVAIGHAPWLGSGIGTQDLYRQDWVCLANPRDPRLRDGLDMTWFQAAGHVGIASGTGSELLERALSRARLTPRVVLELPGFLGLGPIIATTDLIATLPRHIGETLARQYRLTAYDCPLAVEGFIVRQHWHLRYAEDPSNRWLRTRIAELFAQPAGRGDRETTPGPPPNAR
jgi:DNA-binding transcriptional LysR family regulator